MSASQTTATRRELRRAFGPRAIETLNAQADQVQQLALLCQALTQDVDALRRDMTKFRDQIEQQRIIEDYLSTATGTRDTKCRPERPDGACDQAVTYRPLPHAPRIEIDHDAVEDEAYVRAMK